ncbi:MAG: hypothetical protein RLZZ546_1401 [Bacteroidota bacterium]|jgi:quinol monooxygenase YgiN
MITRIVKLTFDPNKVEDFILIFDETKTAIHAVEGNCYLALVRDIHQKNVFFTISKWKDEAALNEYRKSILFQNVWSKTKALFSHKPEAWTTEEYSSSGEWHTK